MYLNKVFQKYSILKEDIKMRKQKKRNEQTIQNIQSFLVAVVIAIPLSLLYYAGERWEEKQKAIELETVMNETEKAEAIEILIELRGKVMGIKSSFTKSNSSSEEFKALLNASVTLNTTNKHLTSFKIATNSFEIGDICDEIILQIDKKIQSIKIGEVGI